MAEYRFNQLVDIGQVRQLLESHHRLSRMAYGILDPDENILVAVGWQDVCSRFHRINPVSNARCLESNTYIHDRLLECAGDYVESQCRNGLIDAALPIIISGKHVATFYAGQFFYDDRPDTAFFRNQAGELGFDVDDYLASLELVPVFSRDYVRDNMLFLRNMVNVLAENGLNNLRLAREMEERKFTEQRLELLGFALDNVHEAAFLMDLSGRFHYVNQKACRSLGYTRDELLGLAIPDIDPDYQEESLPHIFDRLLEQGTHTFETRHQAKDGRIFPVEITSTVLEHNGARYNLALVRDITERKAAQAMLQDERLLLKTLIQTLPDPVWLKDVNGVFLACNAAFGLLYDDTPSGIVGRRDNDYVGNELASFFQQKDRESIAAGGPRTNEEWVTYASDGHQALWETTKTPVYDVMGRVVGALGVARDITEHRRLEDELRAKEQYQRALLDNFPFMVWLKDTDSRLLAVNRPYLEIAGLAADDPCFGKTDLDLFPSELAEHYRADDREVMASGQKKTVEELVGVSGALRWHETYKAPVLDADGKLLGTVGFARDISERKRIEHQLRLLNFALDHVGEAAFLIDEHARFHYVNDEACRSLGYGRDQLLGMEVADINPDMTVDIWRGAWPRFREMGVHTMETSHKAADGRIFPVEIAASYIEYDDTGYKLALARDITERKRMEDTLRESERKYRTLAESLPDNIARYDRECRATYYNSAMAGSVAIDKERFLGRTPLEAHPETAETAGLYEGKIRLVLAGGAPDELEIVVPHPDGGLRTHLIRIVAERDMAGAITGALAIGRDITERKQAEDALIAREREFRTLAENTPDVIVRYDRECRRIYVNPAFERVNLLTSREALGKTPIELSTELAPLAVTFTRRLREVLESGVSTQLDLAVTKDGIDKSWFVRVIPEFDSNAVVVSALTIWTDITERKRLETALRESEQKFRTLAENSPDSIVRYDRQCRRSYINPPLVRAFGGETGTLLGKTPVESYPEGWPGVAGFEEKLRRVLTSGEPDETEIAVPQASGEPRIHLVRLAAERDSAGTIIGVLGIGRDITERKQTERQLQDARSRLFAVFTTIPDLVWLKSTTGVYLACNPAFEKFFGAPEARIVGKTDHDFVPAELADFFIRKDREAIAAGKVCVNEEEIVYADDGRRGILETRKVPVYDADGMVSGVLGVARDITERKETEERLRASEQRFREIFDNSLDCLYLLEVTEEGRFRNLEINPALERSIGKTRAELIGKYVDETVSAETGAAVVAKYRRCVAAGTIIEEEIELELPSGHLFFYSTLVPVRDASGRIHRIVGITRDITRRKQAEVALKNSERRLADIINLLPDATFAIDLEGRVTIWNRAAEEFTGARAEQMLGKGNYEHAIPFYGERRPILIDRVLNPFEQIEQRYPYAQNEDDLLSGEAYTLSVKRGEAYVLGVAAPLYDSEGNIIGAIESVRDITERKRTESALGERERQYRDLSEEFQTLLNGIPDLILHLNPEMTIIWANQAATEFHGDDVKGLHCHEVFHDRDEPCERCPIIRAFSSGENEEEVIVDKDSRHWGIKAFPLKDQQGRVVSVIDYATDITEKMHLRDTAAQARHLAALGELSAGVAHEINNPNGVILLNSTFLKRAFSELVPLLEAQAQLHRPLQVAGMEIDEVLQEVPLLLSEIHDGARRIQRIVDGLKEFVRTPVADPEPVDLNSVVAAAIRVTAAQIEAATAHLTITYGAGVETVQGSRQAIEQVVINLLTNACQALPDRERGIWITTRFLAESGKAMIEVRDAGSGILAENLPHITDPFFTTKRQSGGTGLGLSISNSLIKECGGTLQFFSSPGAGTTVTVTLPLWKAKDKR